MGSLLRRSLAALVVLGLAASFPAQAGQVRVNVGGAGNTFSPSSINLNTGDHVIFIWSGGSHAVASGNPAAATQNGSGLFRNTNSAIGRIGEFYTWKATGTGAITYYCFPHAPSMAGTLNISASGVATADMRITEVQFSAAGGLDLVQVTNLGTDTGFLGRFRVSSVAGVSSELNSATITLTAGSSCRIHLNASGTNTSADTYLPAHPELGTAGSFALYVPNNTLAANGSLHPASLNDADQMVDYVEWGMPGQAAQPNQATAVTAGFWSASTVVDVATTLPAGGAGYSIVFCGSRTDRGAGFWNIATPNFGTAPMCSTPTRTATWGRIKSLYR